MHKLITTTCAIAAGLMLVGGTVGADCTVEHEVEKIGDQLEKAMLEDDLDAMLVHYVDDAISLPMYSPMVKGKEAMIAHHAEMKASGMKVTAFESEPVTVWTEGDAVIEVGTYEITLEMPGAPEPVNDHGKYMTVYERQADGTLKIKAETWNTDINPMMMDHGHDHDDGSDDL